MSEHALLSPSSADCWMVCPGSVLMGQGIPDVESEYAIEGTRAHTIASEYLTVGAAKTLFDFEDETLSQILIYTEEIKKLSKDHTLLVEQRLPIGHVTLEEGAEGTGDAIILHSDGETLDVNDLKFGMGVKVYAKENRQMMLYALGALHQFAVLGEWKKVILRIHQPRLNHMDEWECSVEELQKFAEEVESAAQFIWRLLRGEVKFKPAEDLVPSEKGCMWCKAKATCPALAAHTLKVVAEDFVDITKNPVAKINTAMHKIEHATNQQLSWYMQNLGLIEDWIKAVRQKTEGELLAGHEIPGFKIVAGKKGNRKWEDEKLVEEKLKAWRLTKEDMYNLKIISPTDAEKFFKKNPKRWTELISLITQNEGKPSVAPSTDPRPALAIGASEDDFNIIEEGA